MAAHTLVVHTRQGDLEGTTEGDARVWRGIPFAQPPVGALRGVSPQPPLAWNGVRIAAAFGPRAVQQFSWDASQPESEDCLYLNIWAPAAEAEVPRPVLVWIHGGGFVIGSGSDAQYNGVGYATRGDLVYVTINYRLGGFGFLLNDRDPASANLGLLDQMAALQWIQDNIAAFGGDPQNVTLMGESAGGMSIAILLGTPRAAGLFHKAIVQSGGVKPVYAAHEPAHVLRRMLDAASVDNVEALMNLPTDAFNAACQQVAWIEDDPILGGIPFHPAIDNVVLPAHPLDHLRRIPTLVGTCTDEIGLFEIFDNKPLINGMPVRWRHDGGAAWWQALTDIYQATARGERWRSELLGDGFIGIPSLRLADALAAGGTDVWAYRFDYAGASEIGATHGADVSFTFNSPSAPPLPVVWNDTAQRLGAQMQDTFIAFARTGSPQIADLPEWPMHTPDGLDFMVFDSTCRIERDSIGAERRAAWAALPDIAL